MVMQYNFFKKILLLLILLFSIQASYAKPIKLLLDWYINPDHAPILVAISQGYFKKYNLEVELIEPTDPSDTAKLIAMQKADIAITYQPHYLQQIKQGLPIKKIGTLIATPLDCLVYLPNSGIQSPQDLKGKRIGYSDASSEFLLLEKVLKSGGLSMSDVTMINVHYSLLQALMLGKIDVAEGMMRNVEPVILQQQHFSPQMFYPEKFGVPNYAELIYIAYARDTRFEIMNFLQAIEDATHSLKNNPEAAWQSIIQSYPQLNTPINQAIWEKTRPLFATHPQYF